MRLKWLHQAQFAGFYVARDNGFYKKAGLDVNLEPEGSNYPAIETVVNGGEAFGVLTCLDSSTERLMFGQDTP